ncbi:PAS domain-containing protein [Candidatus Omnitrophota bacterium]
MKNRAAICTYMGWFVILFLSLSVYPLAIKSTWVSDAHLHGTIEIMASLFAISAVSVILARFFAIGEWLYLIIGLGFLIAGAEDLVHGIMSLGELPGPLAGYEKFIPGTYVAGRMALIFMLIFAAILKKKGTQPLNIKKGLLFYVSIALSVGLLATIIAIKLPLPQFIYPGRIISRPVDLVSGLFYLGAIPLYIRLYSRDKGIFLWSMVASLILGMVAQIYMVHSQKLYDAQFDISHLMKIFSYMFPVLGVGFGAILSYKKERSLTEDLQKTTVFRDYVDNILSSMADILVVVTPDGKIEKANKMALDILGYEEKELLGKDISLLFSEEEEEEEEEEEILLKKTRLRKLITEGILKGYEINYKTKDDRKIPVLLSSAAMKDKDGNVASIVCVAKDITERKKTEKEISLLLKDMIKSREIMSSMLEDNNKIREDLEKSLKKLKETQSQLIHAEKMEAIGRMASSVAHEVKNPLGIILQGINYFEGAIYLNQKAQHEVLRMMKNNVKRADNIVRALLDFSRTEEIKMKPEYINSIIKEALLLVATALKDKDIKVFQESEKDTLKIIADRGKFEQVFICLFINAIAAMPKKGKLYVRSYLRRFDKAGGAVGNRENDIFKLGEEVVTIEVEDTGTGIDEDVKKRIFEPFFTTKGLTGGTGLGLSVAKSIIDMHGGLINFESEKGKGAKFIITLKVFGG